MKPSHTNLQNIEWKYFYVDDKGITQSTTEESEVPSDLNKVAILTTSSFFVGSDKNPTPKKMKAVIDAALHYNGRNPKFCLAVPYEKNYGAKYYTERDPQYSDYEDLVMHDSYISITPTRGLGNVSSKRGAAQIISAIEHGYHILSMSGGECFDQKIELVRDYFRQNPLPENHKKPSFFGYSDGSSAAFGLRELLNFNSSAGANLFSITSPEWRGINEEPVRQLVQILESKEDTKISRKLSCDNDEVMREMDGRYQESVQEKRDIKYIAYFPRQLKHNINSPYRVKFDENERLIIGVEGYLQASNSYNASEVLFEAFSKKVFKSDQVIGVVIENIICKAEDSIRRIHGKIPQYQDLSENEKIEVLEILKIHNADFDPKKLNDAEQKEAVENYIERSNHAYENEAQKVKKVCEHFGVPVIFGGEVRVGHAMNYIVQPVNIHSLGFDYDRGEILATSTVKTQEEVRDLQKKFDVSLIRPTDWLGKNETDEDGVVVIGAKVPRHYYEYEKNPELDHNQAEQTAKIREIISAAKIAPLNQEARNFNLNQNAEIIGGEVTNVAETNIEDLQGKGLFLPILPVMMDKTNMSHYAYALALLINSGKLGKSIITPDVDNPPFVIFQIAKDSTYYRANDSEPVREFKAERTAGIIKKTLEEFGITTPVFYSTEPINVKELPKLFKCRLPLKDLLQEHEGLDLAKPQTEPPSDTRRGYAEKMSQVKGSKFHEI